MFKIRILIVAMASLAIATSCFGQQQQLFVDSKGVLRWQDTRKEANFFGVNYTVPFAYGYRSHKALGINPEEAIRRDVYHMARLGLDAFRVHVWDTEISDTSGNLLQNEHLRLFDFLIAELKKRKIKTLVTPIAFWGNGYPERDEKTPGFAAKYGKSKSLVVEEAIKAQENYLRQFYKHVNPYTGLSYLEDPDIVATEINNEPQHSGVKELARSYVDRMAAAIRSTGWTKPIFYNISESPWYADAIAQAKVDGFSFQWYPTGLVANQTLKGNFLPHVDRYHIPFDTIPAFRNKARMVYEFDAGDVLEPVMYPAMARSFRTAGMQWATQFAYDPLATAHANTEYQTHYLNLAYTPKKAISLLIAAKVFHRVPLGKSYGVYPRSSSFEEFRVDYKSSLSEMNSPAEFYYSNNTSSKPVAPGQLKRIAGVGSSPLVKYTGTGAYFLDRLDKGVWRLEVMPDAVIVSDPFAKASPKKEVVRLFWQSHDISISLADLGKSFNIEGLNAGNQFSATAKDSRVSVRPGTYLLTKGYWRKNLEKYDFGSLELRGFEAPQSLNKDVFVYHHNHESVPAMQPFKLNADIGGLSAEAKVDLQLAQLGGRYQTIEMKALSPYNYQAEIPAEFMEPGLINYRIIVQDEGAFTVFPGPHKGDPWAWDNHENETWKMLVTPNESNVRLYDAAKDQFLWSEPKWDSEVKTSHKTTGLQAEISYNVLVNKAPKSNLVGFQVYIGDKISANATKLAGMSKLIINARGIRTSRLKVSLIDNNGNSYSAAVPLAAEMQRVEVALQSFKPDHLLLLPRPYPGFQPLTFKSPSSASLEPNAIEKLEVRLSTIETAGAGLEGSGFEIRSVALER